MQDGLNHLGICGGGFFAGKYNFPYNGLNLTSGVRFGFYAAESRGIRKAAVSIAVAGAPTLDQYWEDGPEFTGWGAVVGKYPDGTPRNRRRNIREWVGNPQRGSPRGSGKLAARNDLQYACQRG